MYSNCRDTLSYNLLANDAWIREGEVNDTRAAWDEGLDFHSTLVYELQYSSQKGDSNMSKWWRLVYYTKRNKRWTVQAFENWSWVADKNCGRIVENKGFARPIPSKPTLSWFQRSHGVRGLFLYIVVDGGQAKMSGHAVQTESLRNIETIIHPS